MELFFCSDWHLRHENTWKLFRTKEGKPLRPFTSTPEMDETIIQRHNSKVRIYDHYYNLGDVCMINPKHCQHLLKQFKGHGRLLFGNHDIYDHAYYRPYFEKLSAVRVLDGILFSHYPVHPKSLGRYRANVHGHAHAGPDLEPEVVTDIKTGEQRIVPYINITVEHTDYYPLSFSEIKERIQKAVDGYSYKVFPA